MEVQPISILLDCKGILCDTIQVGRNEGGEGWQRVEYIGFTIALIISTKDSNKAIRSVEVEGGGIKREERGGEGC